VNGQLTGTTSNGATGAVSANLELGGLGNTAATKAVYETFALWRGRCLTADEVCWLYEEPYAMFARSRVTRTVRSTSSSHRLALMGVGL
jgi:hypothetical protein